MSRPLVTVAVPSLDHGRFLDAALRSIFDQGLPVEVFLMDGGSGDETDQVIARWRPHLSGWRSGPDGGQAAAINEGVALGTAPYVCWLNSDDLLCEGGLQSLVRRLEERPRSPAAYGRCWTIDESGRRGLPYLTTPFSARLLASYCFICQPGTLIRRTAWDAVAGVDPELELAMDYDLWWKLHAFGGELAYVRRHVASTRAHPRAKTACRRAEHYTEAMTVVSRHTGSVPIKWYLAWPLQVILRGALHRASRSDLRLGPATVGQRR